MSESVGRYHLSNMSSLEILQNSEAFDEALQNIDANI